MAQALAPLLRKLYASLAGLVQSTDLVMRQTLQEKCLDRWMEISEEGQDDQVGVYLGEVDALWLHCPNRSPPVKEGLRHR